MFRKEVSVTIDTIEKWEKEFDKELKEVFDEIPLGLGVKFMRLVKLIVAKIIKSELSQQRTQTIEEINTWVKKMLFDHDGSESEYKAWLSQWKTFLDSLK